MLRHGRRGVLSHLIGVGLIYHEGDYSNNAVPAELKIFAFGPHKTLAL